jgi:hypothetical protein
LIKQEENWRRLLNLFNELDYIIQRNAAKSLANLAISVPLELKAKAEVTELLEKWMYSSDDIVRKEAVRAQASLTSIGMQFNLLFFIFVCDLTANMQSELGPKYLDGMYLLHQPENQMDTVADIVFVHGVTGHPLDTWVTSPCASETNSPNCICWAREWLPKVWFNVSLSPLF